MILAVDLGNYNIKTSEGVMFRSTFVAGAPANPLGEEVLVYGDSTYCMDKESEFEYVFNKNKKNYMPNLLYAISKSTEESKIKLVIGTPVDNLSLSADFKADLEGKTFEFSINGKERKITIEKVGVVAEGVSSFYMLPAEKQADDIMIVDIGGRTVNVVTFRNKRIEYKKTVTYGMIEFYNKVKERYNSQGNNIATEQVYSFVKKGIIKVEHEDEVAFVKRIFNEIESIIKDRNFYKIFVTGGGAETLIDTIKEIEPSAALMSDPINSNCQGNKRIGEVQWKKK